jgi:hypothetical protein
MTAWHITTSDGPVAVVIESSPRGVSARTSGFASPELRCVDTSAERAVVRLFAALALDHGVGYWPVLSESDHLGGSTAKPYQPVTAKNQIVPPVNL